MKPGALIDYKLSLYGIPFSWQTEIEVWEPPHRFVDVQVKGPYKTWIHEHTFTQIEEGCKIQDKVDYSLYGGPLSSIINTLFVKRDVQRIFDYRQDYINKYFK